MSYILYHPVKIFYLTVLGQNKTMPPKTLYMIKNKFVSFEAYQQAPNTPKNDGSNQQAIKIFKSVATGMSQSQSSENTFQRLIQNDGSNQQAIKIFKSVATGMSQSQSSENTFQRLIQQRLIQQRLIQQRLKKLKKLKLNNKRLQLQIKVMNSTLLQKQGKIRIYLRIKPERTNVTPINYKIVQSSILIQKPLRQTLSMSKQKTIYQNKSYQFQKIFNKNSSQYEIFEELSQIVQSAILGKNVTFFAYGQTGSGKSFTMLGQDSHDRMGYIPRCLKYLFKKKQTLSLFIQISVSEIYLNNEIDLLKNIQHNNEISRPKSVNKNYSRSLQSHKKQVFKKTKLAVQDLNQALYYFQKSCSQRSTNKTTSNDKSSRSHLIFEISIKRTTTIKDPISLITGDSKIVLIDLAGQQSLKQNDKKLLQESKSINGSLSELKSVLLAHKRGNKHGGEFKLSQIVEQNLKKKGIAVMLVNVSSQLIDLSQTLQTVKYAQMILH